MKFEAGFIVFFGKGSYAGERALIQMPGFNIIETIGF
jgi:hypothetical protein